MSHQELETRDLLEASVYVLVAIVKKRLTLHASLHTILSVTVFEKTQIQQALADADPTAENTMHANQLNLFAF